MLGLPTKRHPTPQFLRTLLFTILNLLPGLTRQVMMSKDEANRNTHYGVSVFYNLSQISLLSKEQTVEQLVLASYFVAPRWQVSFHRSMRTQQTC